MTARLNHCHRALRPKARPWHSNGRRLEEQQNMKRCVLTAAPWGARCVCTSFPVDHTDFTAAVSEAIEIHISKV